MCDPNFDDDIPDEEYAEVGLFLGYVLSTLRIAIGDFSFDSANFLTP